ncbi:hypothetical protein DS742_09835 [Lacrimispora amygdalina]|uniref:Uncharacterized protein n=1 Tax=Lacrimispora amygdalina TaxID=253257 RepID=A0A3E2NE48_9FIRM|nr:hypothetical protein DS742_09835 [Clostridium indicum]
MYKKSAVFSFIFICCVIISGCQKMDFTEVTTNTNEYASSNNNVETKNQDSIWLFIEMANNYPLPISHKMTMMAK